MRKDVCKHVCLFSSCTTFALLLLCYYCHFHCSKMPPNREYWFWHSLTRNICTSNLTFSTITGTLYFLKTGLVHPFISVSRTVVYGSSTRVAHKTKGHSKDNTRNRHIENLDCLFVSFSSHGYCFDILCLPLSLCRSCSFLLTFSDYEWR
jgi:hypothetical protein